MEHFQENANKAIREHNARFFPMPLFPRTEETTSVAYDMEKNPASPLEYVSSDLKVAASSGATLFDKEAGRVVSKDSKIQITGSIIFEAGGKELPSTLDLTMAQKTKTTSP